MQNKPKNEKDKYIKRKHKYMDKPYKDDKFLIGDIKEPLQIKRSIYPEGSDRMYTVKETFNKTNDSLFDNLRINYKNKCLYVNGYTITEDDLKSLIERKTSKRESYKRERDEDTKDKFESADNKEDPTTDQHFMCPVCAYKSIDNEDIRKYLVDDNWDTKEFHNETNLNVRQVKNLHYLIENRIYKTIDIPQSHNINALFMDFYHIIMAYTFFEQKKHQLQATFEVYFRKCPFEGNFAILAGTYEVIKYINSFRFTLDQLRFIKKKMNNYSGVDLFIEYLSTLSGKDISIYAMEEGSIIFANEPVMIVEGNILTCHLLESAIINLLNYPILIATNSMRYKISINHKTLAEFGCRRAQGPDGALSGSKYSFFGCDYTSNVYASYLYNIPLLGTMSHSFILSFQADDVLVSEQLKGRNFFEIVQRHKSHISKLYNCDYRKENELKAFVAFGQINPDTFICLIDTYDCLRSGIFNFLIVALSLHELGYQPIGIRIDSGDLRYLSNACKNIFNDVSKKLNVPFQDLKICVSNDINEKLVKFLNEQDHSIDIFAIGTNLVTCHSQPSLGLIYKLVQINNQPCFKMTNESKKSNLPYKKKVYRLYTNDNYASVDFIQMFDEPPPLENHKLFCINVLDESKKCYIIPKKVEPKLLLRWKYGKLLVQFKSLQQIKKYTLEQIPKFRTDHFRSTLPIPYKVAFSSYYHQSYNNLLLRNSFITTLT